MAAYRAGIVKFIRNIWILKIGVLYTLLLSGLIWVTTGNICYVGQGSMADHNKLKWTLGTKDWCHCTSLRMKSKQYGDIQVSQDIDQIRSLLNCNIPVVWKYIKEWSPCSVTCGGGSQTRMQSCVYSDNNATATQCSGNAQTETQECNINKCPTWVYLEEWSTCTVTCDGGTQTRKQSCVNSDNNTAEGQCSGNAMTETQACNMDICPTWKYIEEWSTCTRTCGGGTQTHKQSCVNSDNSTADEGQCAGNAITEMQKCNMDLCLPQDCYDILQTYGNATTGSYEIYPYISQPIPLKVWCDMHTDGGGWTLFQRRLDGSVDFYRNWIEYASGFGDIEGEFWLGNEHIHKISTTYGKRFNLRIDMYDGTEWRFALYDGFNITGSEDNYTLKYDTYMPVSNAGDGLTERALNHQFSTYDEDHDEFPDGNCAVLSGGAWWYGACHNSNLNGLYLYGEADPPHGKSVVWVPWKGFSFSLQKTMMKIRPV